MKLIKELVSELVWLDWTVPRIPKIRLPIIWSAGRARRPGQSGGGTWRNAAVAVFAQSIHVRHSHAWNGKLKEEKSTQKLNAPAQITNNARTIIVQL